VASVAERQLRGDAARNAQRLVHAARLVYAETGPDASSEVIAQCAGLGERTLYRRFPSKLHLLKAALASIVADLAPAIDRARRADDPVRGITDLVEAAMTLAAREHNILAAARRAGILTDDVSAPMYEALEELAERAKRTGMIHADLAAEDLPRMIAMLHSVLLTMDPTSGGWRRYVTLMLNAISTGERRPLPPSTPIVYIPQPDSWPK